ncbi:MAG: TIGR04282 family arsenosugar biosynthesis glycosyltransferase [Alphaproteobacteria bacterium]
MRRVRTVVLLVRAPRLGAVKRRLAAGVGDVAAWRFYRATTASVVRRLSGDRRWRLRISVTPDRLAHGTRFWPRGVARMAQGAGDLGQRMARAFALVPPGDAVVIGGDIPGITKALIGHAFALLGAHDAVFGPARDGGYWLIGLSRKRRHPGLFRGVRWSTAHALGDTRARLDRRRRVAVIESLDDVDDAEALWRHVQAESRRRELWRRT